ncbi:hypothetical protein PsorP6_006194 [Peronosclerospora sorghi]|uniref:Uncharacterized protein n=1 Tax=Peronosclerospora sorghi TaxID=230839 RepID=A0ACC0W5C0_9STRA|nr:hypothetical protein PsorP6_006194 [Peronosclerospora sorghi]
MEAVAAKVDVEDDSTALPSPTAAGANVDRQPRLVDVEVDSNAPPTETAADANIEAEFDLVEAPLGVEAKPGFQIKPTIALVPDAVKKSTEDSHFLTKHHTKVVKTTQTITVAETSESMIGDTADVELDLLPDRLVMAATRIPSAHKALKSATNPDRVI